MVRRARWLREHPLCVACEAQGRTTAAQEVDHIIELCDGGADEEGNFQSLCIEHHKAKTADEAERRKGNKQLVRRNSPLMIVPHAQTK